MSSFRVQSEVCMSPFHVQSKVCIAPIHVQSKFANVAPHMDGSNADFAAHIEGRHADFAPHIERRHSFKDQKIAQIAISHRFLKEFVKTIYIAGVYMTYVTSFKNINILRESTFEKELVLKLIIKQRWE